MKQLFFAAAILVAASAKAQMTSEHVYQKATSFQRVNMADIGAFYAYYDTTVRQVRLNTASHTLYKYINYTVPVGRLFSGAWCISTKLFNGDGQVEALITTRTSTAPITYETVLVNDFGVVSQTIPDGTYAEAVNMGGDWKVIVYKVNYEYEVFDVSGSMPGVKAKDIDNPDEVAMSFYPNPMSTVATLQYQLPPGAHTGTVEILNTSGQVLRSYNVGSAMSNILIQRGELPSGVYLYRLNAAGTTQPAGQFVVE